MGTVIKIKLSKESVETAIREVNRYRGSLETRIRTFVGRLVDMGVEVVKARVSESPEGEYVAVDWKFKNPRMGCKGTIYASGATFTLRDGRKANMLMMVEFGAGIHYNHKANPKAEEFGMGVGTFPHQKHAFQEEGWYYVDADGNRHHSFGVKATMPMYAASMEIIQNIEKIAREVFPTDRVVQC